MFWKEQKEDMSNPRPRPLSTAPSSSSVLEPPPSPSTRERRKSFEYGSEEEAKLVAYGSEHLRRNALERLGVYHPKSKEESQVTSLQAEVKELRDTLERERALRFREEQKTKSLQRKEEESLSEELASLSRKLHETRANHQQELRRVQDSAVADVEEQLQRQRGPIYKKLEENMMALLQSQINSGQGELLERVIMATKGFVERQCSTGAGSVYRMIREGVEKDLLSECEIRKGSFYEGLERDIRGKIAKEMSEDNAKEAARFETLEREYHFKLINAVKEIREKLQAEHDRLREELCATMDSTSEASLEAFVQFSHQKAEETTEAVLAQTKNTQTAIQDRLEQHLKNLMTSEEAHLNHMREMVEAGTKKLEEALQQQEKDLELRTSSEKKALGTQLESISNVLEHERNSFRTSLETIRAQHQQSREDIASLLKLERERMETEKKTFEENLKAQFEMLTASLKEQQAEALAQTMRRQVDLTAKEALMEQKELQIARDATTQAEIEVNTRWEEVLREKRAAWKREEESRRISLESDLSHRFDLQLRAMEDRLQAAQELRASAEAAWAHEQTKVAQSFAKQEEQFKDTCERLFHERMDRYIEASEVKMQEIQEGILQEAASAAEVRAQLETRVDKIRAEAELSKAAYALQVQEKHQQDLVNLQSDHSREMTKLAEELKRAREEILTLKSLHVRALQQTTCERITDSVELQKLRDIMESEAVKLRAGERVLEQHRDKILSLWSILKLDASCYEDFLLEVFQTAPYSADLEKLLEQHVHTLAARIPITKTIAERDDVLTQLQVRSWTSRGETDEHVEQERLLARFGSLNKRLEIQLDEYNQCFPHDSWALLQCASMQETIRRVPGATLCWAAEVAAPISNRKVHTVHAQSHAPIEQPVVQHSATRITSASNAERNSSSPIRISPSLASMLSEDATATVTIEL